MREMVLDLGLVEKTVGQADTVLHWQPIAGVSSDDEGSIEDFAGQPAGNSKRARSRQTMRSQVSYLFFHERSLRPRCTLGHGRIASRYRLGFRSAVDVQQ